AGNGSAARTSAAAHPASGAANDVPLPNPYRPAREPGSATGKKRPSAAWEERALKTFSPGAASEMYDPVFENDARSPEICEAATESPDPPRPFDPAGWRSAAGSSTGAPLPHSLRAGATSS